MASTVLFEKRFGLRSYRIEADNQDETLAMHWREEIDRIKQYVAERILAKFRPLEKTPPKVNGSRRTLSDERIQRALSWYCHDSFSRPLNDLITLFSIASFVSTFSYNFSIIGTFSKALWGGTYHLRDYTTLPNNPTCIEASTFMDYLARSYGYTGTVQNCGQLHYIWQGDNDYRSILDINWAGIQNVFFADGHHYMQYLKDLETK